MTNAADPPRPPSDGHPAQPTMSVVVPTRNRVAMLPATLAPLLADAATTELVVVDDGSSDDTPTVLADLAGRGPPGAAAAARGAGGRPAPARPGREAATGEVVLFIDDDVVGDAGLVTGHARRQAEGGGDVVVVGYMPTRLPEPRLPGQFATVLYQREYEGHCRRWEADPDLVLEKLWAGNISLPRDRGLEVGLASPRLAVAYHEDRDLGLRLRDAGADGGVRPLAARQPRPQPLPGGLHPPMPTSRASTASCWPTPPRRRPRARRSRHRTSTGGAPAACWCGPPTARRSAGRCGPWPVSPSPGPDGSIGGGSRRPRPRSSARSSSVGGSTRLNGAER